MRGLTIGLVFDLGGQPQTLLAIFTAGLLPPVWDFFIHANVRIDALRYALELNPEQPGVRALLSSAYHLNGMDAEALETAIAEMTKGDQAIVTLMTYPDQPLEGSVDSLGWGIAQQDGSTGFELLPNVSPTFEWIRLAQRIPVRIQLDKVPEDVALRIGTTGSVLVRTGTGDREE